MTASDYLPAAGRRWLLPLYDPLIALLTREPRWRGAILESLDLGPDDILVDVGCGTGTLAIMAKQRTPRAQVIGVDPDPAALSRARRKAAARGVAVTFHRGLGSEVAGLVGPGRATKVVSSLAFHHMPPDVQAQTLAAIRETLVPGGSVRIADFVGGHFGGPAETRLLAGLTAGGFEHARWIRGFRVVFIKVAVVGAEKPRRASALASEPDRSGTWAEAMRRPSPRADDS